MDQDESVSGVVDPALAGSGEYGWEEPAGVRRTVYLPAEVSSTLAEVAQARGVTVNVLIAGFITEGLRQLGYAREKGEQG